MYILTCAVFISTFGTLNSLSSVELEWRVVPTDGHHCIRNHNIQIAGPNESQWEEEIPGSSHSLNFTGLQLIPFQEYTYRVTANLLHGQIGLKQCVNFTELQGGLKYDKVITKLNQSMVAAIAVVLKVLDLSPSVIDLSLMHAVFRSVYETLTFIASCLVLYYSQPPL